MRRAVVFVLVLSTFGCQLLKKKKPPTEDTDIPSTTSTATASVAPKAAPPPPFVAPAPLPADEVYLLADSYGGAIRVDARGGMKRDDLGLRDVHRAKDGTVYATTNKELRKKTGAAWKIAKSYGDKTWLAVAGAKKVALRMRGPAVIVLADSATWSGRVDDQLMIGSTYSLLTDQILDGNADLWALDSGKLLVEKMGKIEPVKWAPARTVALAPRAGGGVFAVTDKSVVIGDATASSATVALPFEASGTTKVASGPTDTLVLKASSDSLVFVGASGGVSTVKAKASDVFAVDGRSRVWTLDGDELRVISPDGTVVTKKVAAALKPASVVRIVALGGGADVK